MSTKQRVKKTSVHTCSLLICLLDILTKALARDRHEVLIEIMGLEYNATSQSGSIGR